RRDSLPGYRALLRVEGPDGRDYGDAGAWLTLPSGPAQGGKILYLWSTLLTAPQGSTLLGDALTWLLPETMAGGG
ncbi:MAG: hypothetical protein HUU35_18745, partial [Armatimonadetes bacterium]|nr:hypothetical protein [Armatimonadota bacterium]